MSDFSFVTSQGQTPSPRELNNPEIREILFGSYRIVYRVKDELVEILTIYHGARLLDPSRLK